VRARTHSITRHILSLSGSLSLRLFLSHTRALTLSHTDARAHTHVGTQWTPRIEFEYPPPPPQVSDYDGHKLQLMPIRPAVQGNTQAHIVFDANMDFFSDDPPAGPVMTFNVQTQRVSQTHIMRKSAIVLRAIHHIHLIHTTCTYTHTPQTHRHTHGS
jgi:hypothetical protein